MVSTFTNLDYQVGKYFKVREFQSKDGYPTVLIDDNLVDLLDQIREYFGKPVVITSGYRTKSHNAAVGGVSNSQHTLGKAADIQVTGVPQPQCRPMSMIIVNIRLELIRRLLM